MVFILRAGGSCSPSPPLPSHGQVPLSILPSLCPIQPPWLGPQRPRLLLGQGRGWLVPGLGDMLGACWAPARSPADEIQRVFEGFGDCGGWARACLSPSQPPPLQGCQPWHREGGWCHPQPGDSLCGAVSHRHRARVMLAQHPRQMHVPFGDLASTAGLVRGQLQPRFQFLSF